ncbi:Ldh family oxidoreductase [Chloroflexota bacterium]
MTKSNTVDPKKLTIFTKEAFIKVGISPKDAQIAANMLVATDLRGVDSHGVARLYSHYINRLKSRQINANPQIKMSSFSPSTVLMDADQGLGFVIGNRAMSEAIRLAHEVGSGFVSVRNSTHFGAGANYSMMALKHGMIGISMTQGGKGVVIPHTLGPSAGINVMSVAVPAKKEKPYVLDMATSVVARGKLQLAQMRNVSIPEGWAVDKMGNPVTNADEADAILPLGGTPKLGSYKGFGLTFLVEILCSVLSGGLSYPKRPAGLNVPGPAHFFGAIRVDGFMPVEEFTQSMDAMIKACHNLPKAQGVDKVYMPGEVEFETEENRKAGIPLHPKVIASLKTLAEELGIAYNL